MKRYDFCEELSSCCDGTLAVINECQDGDYVKHDDAAAEVAARDAEIERLKSQLSACAAGPWRKPTDEDIDVLQREAYASSRADDPKLMSIFNEGFVECVATINPPEETK